MAIAPARIKWYNVAGEWGETYWPEIVQTLGAGSLGLPQILALKTENVWSWVLFVLGLMLFFTGIIGGARRSKANVKLESERNDLSSKAEHQSNVIRDLIKFYLVKLASDIGLGDHERISVFHHVNGGFYPLGRYSPTERYCRSGRRSYPDDQGCIGEAWRLGEVFVNDLPDPANNIEPYVAATYERFRIPGEVTRALSMKSRSYVGIRFRDLAGMTSIGIVVIESTRVDSLDFELIKNLFTNTEGKRLAQILEITRYKREMIEDLGGAEL